MRAEFGEYAHQWQIPPEKPPGSMPAKRLRGRTPPQGPVWALWGRSIFVRKKRGGGPQAAALWSQAPRCRAGQGGAGFHRREKPGGRCPGNPDFKGQVAPPQMSAPGCGRKGGRRPPSACTAGSPTLSQSLMNSRTSPMNTPPNQGNLKRDFLSLSHGGGAPSRGERTPGEVFVFSVRKISVDKFTAARYNN